MGKIEQQFMETIENEAKKLKDDPIIKKFKEADKEFSNLVEKGLATRRGNNLISIEDYHLKRFAFNSK